MTISNDHKQLIKTLKVKENFADNHVHKILRIFEGWANFPFTTCETKRDY